MEQEAKLAMTDEESPNGPKPREKKPTGKAIGAKARADALSPERRKEIAKKAAAARWGEKAPKATHKGSFKEDFGIDVDCYVLDDDQKTAVVSQRGMGAALGLGQTGGAKLPRFLDGEKVAPYVGPELGQKIRNPIVFQLSSPASNQPITPIYGYDVTILIDVCKTIIKAQEDGGLLKRQAHIARQAQVIVNASAKAGIKGLVYALAGYDAKREDVIQAFKFYVREEAREYEKSWWSLGSPTWKASSRMDRGGRISRK
jgi:hypothetical protein